MAQTVKPSIQDYFCITTTEHDTKTAKLLKPRGMRFSISGLSRFSHDYGKSGVYFGELSTLQTSSDSKEQLGTPYLQKNRYSSNSSRNGLVTAGAKGSSTLPAIILTVNILFRLAVSPRISNRMKRLGNSTKVTVSILGGVCIIQVFVKRKLADMTLHVC